MINLFLNYLDSLQYEKIHIKNKTRNPMQPKNTGRCFPSGNGYQEGDAFMQPPGQARRRSVCPDPALEHFCRGLFSRHLQKKKVLFHCRHLSVSSGDAWPRGCPVWRRPMAGGQDAWQAAPCTGQLAVSRASALLLRAVRIFKPNKPDVSGRRNSLSDFNCNLAPGTL